MMAGKCKKGDVVALAFTRSATYAFGSGRGTERRTLYTLALVNGASRDGDANSLRRRSGTILVRRREDFSLNDVMVIGGANQSRAQSLFKRLTWETDEFASADELRAAILNEEVH